MLLSKSFLNEQVQKRILTDSLSHSQRKELDEYDVFVSYSWNDRAYADKVVQLLEKCGYTVYIDYKDLRLDRADVTEETAIRLIAIMKKCKGLFHLYSPSTSVSKWCPWEVGIFSGMKKFRCANLPLVEKQSDDFKKQEYLEIYPYVEYELYQEKQKYDFWICESNRCYTTLRSWLNGNKPYMH